MINIAILASGSGTNTENICNYFNESKTVNVALIISNKTDAFVLERAKNLKIDSVVFSKKEFDKGDLIIEKLKEYNIEFIVLSGFLLKISDSIIENYPNKIINIHPALLPKYGGKGMYGDNVHKAVCEAKEKESGITIHYVNNRYDEGEIILQVKCDIEQSDTADDIASKIHTLEYEHFPKAIEETIKKIAE